MKLSNISEKKFALDSSTSVRPQFAKIYNDNIGKRKFTFLNTYNHRLYFYDYETGEFQNTLSFEDAQIPQLFAYHIKNIDSIYLFNRLPGEFTLVNSTGHPSTKISLIGDSNPNDMSWIHKYPQFYPRTVTPILEHNGSLFFSGEYMTSIPDQIIDDFQFTAAIRLSDSSVTFLNKYPENLYGKGKNWGDDGLFNNVYYDIVPEKNIMLISFPISHQLYLSNVSTGKLDSVYASSNFGGTISSFPYPKGSKDLSTKELISKVSHTGLYTAILYDQYRDIYYRFFLNELPETDPGTDWKEKTVSVIIFDTDFKYLGETDLGTMKQVNWENSFVTSEGLNVEFINPDDLEEEYLTFKIFAPTKI